jgi:hypothetical protein
MLLRNLRGGLARKFRVQNWDCDVGVRRWLREAYPRSGRNAAGGSLGDRRLAAQHSTTRGLPPQPFKFKTLGLLATIGRRAGVAEILNMKFSGIIAWWLWRAIYLILMPGLQKKVRVALDWTLDLFFSKDIVQLPTLHSVTISQTDDSRLPVAEINRTSKQQSNGDPKASSVRSKLTCTAHHSPVGVSRLGFCANPTNCDTTTAV